jgi:hypothetical protein
MPDRYGGDESDARIAERSMAIDELCARISNIFVRKNLSPPFHLKPAAEGWLCQGLTPDEIVHVVWDHLQNHRSNYHGSGDSSLGFLRFEIARAAEAKHPSHDRAADEPQRPRRRRSRVRDVHTAAGGRPDLIVDGGPISRLLPAQISNIEPPSGLVDYEESGDPIGIGDDDGDAA